MSLPIPQDKTAALNLRSTADGFAIEWPADTNIFHMTLGKHLGPDTRNNPAMIFEDPAGHVTTQSFAEVDRAATNLAAALRNLGYGRGSLIGIHTGQHPDTATAHMAVCKLGGVAVTLSQLYGPDTLRHAMNDCDLPVMLTSDAAWAAMRDTAKTDFPSLRHVLCRGAAPG